MKINRIFLFFCITFMPILSHADEIPSIDPIMFFVNEYGDADQGTEFSGPAPFEAEFHAQAENTDGWTEYYEWRFTREGEEQPFLIRYEADTSYKFTKAGSTKVVLYANFTRGSETVEYTEEYWQDATPLTISISESSLDMPNAFSPNGDGINDVYKAKQGYKSLVEFHAAIYNRWGQKLFEWTDPADGWDGTFHGRDVAQGVYFVKVEALGADGIKYHFKKDVNLLRGYREDNSVTE